MRTITSSQVSGCDEGTLLDGTFTRRVKYTRGPTGLRLSDIRIAFQGGGTAADAALEPDEKETEYPEPDKDAF